MDSSPDHPPASPAKPRILVTGASGFIGQAVCQALLAAGYAVHGQVRHGDPPAGVIPLRCDLTDRGDDDFGAICPPVAGIVHLAGLAHRPIAAIGRELLWRTNVDATLWLARTAARQGAHFIYLSSAKVLGESGEWADDAAPAPVDPYAQSKLAAETAIRAVPDLAYTILRPPLVYGPGVKGNFLRLLQLAQSGWPLPLASLDNRRSLLYVDNLAAAIGACLLAPAAAGKTWLLSDGEAWPVATLLRQLAMALGQPARLFPVRPALLLGLARLCGRTAEAERLTGQFILHDRQLRAALDWSPPCDPAAGLQATAAWFLNRPPPPTPPSPKSGKHGLTDV